MYISALDTNLVSKIHRQNEYSLIQKKGYTFAIVYSSKYVSNFLNQTLIKKIFWKKKLKKKKIEKKLIGLQGTL